MNKSDIKPSRLYYILAAVVLLIGIALPAWAMVSLLGGVLKPPISTIIVPGEGEVLLEKAGKYVICYEHRSVINGKVYVGPEAPPGLECRLVSKATGQEVSLKATFGSYSYTHGSREGVAVWDINVNQPGTYELSAWYPEGVEGPEEVVLVVNEDFPWRGMVGMFVSVPLAIICFCGAAAIFLVTLLKRISSKKRLAEYAGRDAAN